MEFRAEVKSIDSNNVTFALTSDDFMVSDIPRDPVRLRISKYREHRSLNSNAYFWTLCSQMAEILHTSKIEMYEQLLQKYGTNEKDENDNVVTFSVRSDVAVYSFVPHCAPIGSMTIDGIEYTNYRLIKGSSELNTKQMSILIDGTVDEAKELGIETMTPDEIARMNAEWEKCRERKHSN